MQLDRGPAPGGYRGAAPRAERAPPWPREGYGGAAARRRLLSIWSEFTGRKSTLPRGDSPSPWVEFLRVTLKLAGAKVGGERAARDVREAAREIALRRRGIKPAYERAYERELERINELVAQLREGAALEKPELAQGVDKFPRSRRPKTLK
jgi:hypothetical protein